MVEVVRVGGRVDVVSACFGVRHPSGFLVCLSCEVVEPGACWGGYSWRLLLLRGSMIVVISSLLLLWVV